MEMEIMGESLLGSRSEQQDCFIYKNSKDLIYAAVCDGMGGMPGGDKASRLTAKLFGKDIKEAWPITDIPAFLTDEVHRLDEAVFCLNNEDGRRLGAGTTIVSVLVTEGQLHVMAVGDSRIFLRRGHEMLPVNREHNYRLLLDAYRQEGSITEEAYCQEQKQGERLISYLGHGNVTVWDVSQHPIALQAEDWFLLCSDGVTKTLSQPEILAVLEKSTSVSQAVNSLRTAIIGKNKRYQDNATYVVARFGRKK